MNISYELACRVKQDQLGICRMGPPPAIVPPRGYQLVRMGSLISSRNATTSPAGGLTEGDVFS